MSKNREAMDTSGIHKNYLSRSSKGRQVMAGSLTMLGGLKVDGISKVKDIETNAVTSSQISASGTITANLFSGSGASLTNVPATSLTGTINQARLTDNVMLTNKAQTVTSHLTMSSAANLYFAGGSSFWVNTAGNARLNALTLNHNLSMSGNRKMTFSNGGVGGPGGTSGTKIDFLNELYSIGLDNNTLWYNSHSTHRFHTGGSRTVATIDSSGITSENDLIAKRNLDVQGEVKVGGGNRFPDPLCASGGIGAWSGGVFERIQKPFDEVAGSIRLTSTSASDTISYEKRFDTSPGDTQTFSSYIMATTASKEVGIYIEYFNASGTSIASWGSLTTAPTRWGRISTTQTAPANAVSLRVRVGNRGGSGTVMYFTGFQLEYGSAMTPFQPFSGSGETASFTNDGIMLGSNKALYSGHSGNIVLKDHANGNITMSAAGGNLQLGYQTTNRVLLNTDLYGGASNRVIDTAGRLYYQGHNTDNRYLRVDTGGTVSGDIKSEGSLVAKDRLVVSFNNVADERYKFEYNGSSGRLELHSFTSGNQWVKRMDFPHRSNGGDMLINGQKVWYEGNDGHGSGLDADTVDNIQGSQIVRNDRENTVNGDFRINKSNAWLTVESLNTGGNNTDQAAGISIGESGHKGSAAMHLTYTGNGYGHIGMGPVSDATGRPQHQAMEMYYTRSDVKFFDTPNVNGNKIWHEGNDGSGSGLDADTVDGVQLSQIVRKDTDSTISGAITLSGGFKNHLKLARSGTSNWLFTPTNRAGDSLAIMTDNESSQFYFSDDGNIYVGPHTQSNKVWHSGNHGTGSGLSADMVDGLHASSFLRSNANTTMSQTLTVSGKLNVSGDMDIQNPIYLTNLPGGNHRESGKLNTLSRIAGRIVNKNSDFISGETDGYTIYDNGRSGRVQTSIVTDNMTPSATGKVMRISYDPARSTTEANPGYGGIYTGLQRDTGSPSRWGYRGGNRYVFRVVAKIPVGRSLQFGSNALGSGGGNKWMTSQAGTGDWQEYAVFVTIGNSGTMSSTGFFYVQGGADTAFTWDIAIYQVIGVDEVPDVDRAPSLNVGYKQKDLPWGSVYATGEIITDSNLEVKGDLFLTGNDRDWAFRAQGEHFSLVESDDSNREHIRIEDGGNFDLKPNGITAISMSNAGVTNIKRTFNAEGSANFLEGLTSQKSVTIHGSSKLEFTNSGVGGPGTSGEKISFLDSRYAMGVDSNTLWYNANRTHQFYSEDGGVLSSINISGIHSEKDVTAKGNISASGDVSAAGNINFNNGMLIASNLSASNIDHIWHDDAGSGSHESVGTWHFVSDGSAKANGNAGIRAGSIYMTGGNNYMSGRLGIGVVNPTVSLDVQGSILASSDIISEKDFVSKGNNFTIYQPNSTSSWARGLDFRTHDGAARHAQIGLLGSGTSPTRLYMGFGQSPWSSSPGITVIPNGNVGINTVSPKSDMEIYHSSTSSVLEGRTAYGGLHLSQNSQNDAFTGITTDSTSTGTQAGILFQGSGSYGTKMHFLTTNSHAAGMKHRMTLDQSGNLGIGKDNPVHALDVVGTIHSDEMEATKVTATHMYSNGNINIESSGSGLVLPGGAKIYQSSSADSWTRFSGDIYGSSNIIRTDGSFQVGSGGGNFLASGSTFSVKGSTIYSNTQGRVSINDSSNNEHPLHVKSDLSYSGINIQTSNNSYSNGISFQNSGGAFTWHIARDGSQGNDPDLVFHGSNYNYSMSALPERVRFTSNGRVGVGISNPAEMIHTSGNIQGTELVMGHPTNSARRASWRYDNSHTFGGSSWAYIFKDDQNNRERIYIEQTNAALANIGFNANVNIGNSSTSPSSALQVNHNGSDGHITLKRTSGYIEDWTLGMPFGAFAIARGTDGAADKSMFHIQPNGNVGIGLRGETTSAKSKLHVDGRTESNDGFKTGNFEIQHNSSEDSLDFVYVG